MKRYLTDPDASRLESVFFDSIYWMLMFFAVAFIVFGIFSSVWIFSFGIFALMLGLYAGFVEPYWLRVKRYRLALTEYPSVWMRIVFLSDFHAGSYKRKRFYDRVSSMVASLHPDVIVLGGDLVDERSVSTKDLSSLQRLRAKDGKFFVLGNHDFLDDPDALATRLRSWGFEDLTNEARMVEHEGRKICFVGLDDTWQGQPKMGAAKCEKNAPVILFVHEPDALLDLAEGSANVIMLGHTHGGQLRLPGIGAVRKLPQQVPQGLDVGKKAWRGMPVIISAGLGETGARVRLFCRPEIVVMEVGCGSRERVDHRR